MHAGLFPESRAPGRIGAHDPLGSRPAGRMNQRWNVAMIPGVTRPGNREDVGMGTSRPYQAGVILIDLKDPLNPREPGRLKTDCGLRSACVRQCDCAPALTQGARRARYSRVLLAYGNRMVFVPAVPAVLLREQAACVPAPVLFLAAAAQRSHGIDVHFHPAGQNDVTRFLAGLARPHPSGRQ